MDKTNRDFLHDVIADVLGMDGRKVVWAGANAPKIKPPFVVLHLFGEQGQAGAELRKVQNADGIYKILVPSIATLEVQAYGVTGTDAYEPSNMLTELVRSMEKPTVVDRCFAQGISFAWAEAVQDIPELMADGAQYQPRAEVDFHVCYMHELDDDMGNIDTVKISGDYNPEPQPEPKADGSYLIYGHIAEDGTVTDLDHAIPVNVSVSISDD